MSETAPLLTHDSSSPPKSVWLKSKTVLMSSYVNLLLVFVPVGIACGIWHTSPASVFATNFLAIVPLAAILSYATEELADNVGQTLGGLLNATFGNMVELIVAIVALRQHQIRIVQASMLGSMLSNILLVLGCCFVAGGYGRVQQKFNQTAAQTMASLMALATGSLFIPAAFHNTVPAWYDQKAVVSLSRFTAIVLLVVYVLYLNFQLRTHNQFFEETGDIERDSAQQNETAGETADEPASVSNPHTSILNPVEAVVLLLIVTLLVAFCADYLVDSIDAIVEETGISKTFIGLILLPIVGNAAEHVTAVIVAIKDKMDLAINVAIGSSMQIALFLTPFLVVLGWIMDVPMSLYFSTFETAVLFISVIIVNYLLADGESNWLEGSMLIATYTIIAIAFFFYPDQVN